MIEAEAITIEPGGHVVYFYDDDQLLISTAGDYLAAAIRAGDATLIIATRDHRRALVDHLDAAGIDVAHARQVGTFVTFDAADTLARFYADGHVDADQFSSVIGDAIRQVAQHSGRPVRCFGEMVALLWDADAVTAAIELEELWNALSRELAFALLCSYSRASVDGPEHSHARGSIGELHSEMIGSRPGAQRHFRPRAPRITATVETSAAVTALSREGLASEVHQACGMVAAQLGVTPADALDRLRQWAADHERTLEEAAEDVLSREVRFS